MGIYLKNTIFFTVLGFFACIESQTQETNATLEEAKLYQLINEYRNDSGLTTIPFSKSLTKVAQIHAKDLVDNDPVQGECNMHSWSDQGSWTPCCYTPDHAAAQCMWDKPGELTNYTGYGYENSYGSGGQAKAEGALEAWKKSSGHNDVILNKSIWSREWKALGVGIHGGFAVIWFGHETDPDGNINVGVNTISHNKKLSWVKKGKNFVIYGDEKIYQFSIRDIYGRTIIQQKWLVGKSRIVLPDLQKGLHFVTLQTIKKNLHLKLLN